MGAEFVLVSCATDARVWVGARGEEGTSVAYCGCRAAVPPPRHGGRRRAVMRIYQQGAPGVRAAQFELGCAVPPAPTDPAAVLALSLTLTR